MSLQSVRGTHDLLPEACAKQNEVIQLAREIAGLAGFHEMATPIFEFSEVFKRTLGDASDIVTKEMYSFQDKGGDWLTLRPEGTAGIARAFISEGLAQSTPLKLFYQGPMFRYERPQKGRQRQFHQIGVELLGVSSPLADLECLAAADQLLKALGVRQKSRLEINSLGDSESRKNYLQKLVEFLEQKKSDLSEESQKRLQVNPLRILDSKDKNDQNILTDAPTLRESLNSDSLAFLGKVEEGLTRLGIEYDLNTKLVRGLDYYSHVVFEYRTNDLGAQDAILAGGRYDQLISIMGGPATPGVGWAAGIERLVLLRDLPAKFNRPVVIVALGEAAEAEIPKIAQELRTQGITTDLTYSGNMSKRMKKASALNARYTLIVGDSELASAQVTLKDMDSGEQVTLARNEISAFIKSKK